jgi:hypothetical protein
MEKTYWNGEETPCAKVWLKLEGDGGHPEYWARDMIGQTINAVRVDYHGDIFYLSNEDGSGWQKVTKGHGSPGWPSGSVYGTEVLDVG